jgi:hypothetical protein
MMWCRRTRKLHAAISKYLPVVRSLDSDDKPAVSAAASDDSSDGNDVVEVNRQG